MSISSYRRNVRAGVTGAHTPTCFPAALEQISPNHSLRTVDYNRYRRLIGTMDRLDREGGHERRKVNPIARDLFDTIFTQLGCEGGDVEFRKVTNAYNLRRLVKSVLRQECRVVLDLDVRVKDVTHAVGLIELQHGRFELMSNTRTYGPLGAMASLDEIFPYLHQSPNPPTVRYPFSDTNVTILPPG